MRKAARTLKFWSRKGRLRPSLVLEELGFSELGDHATAEAWQAVVERFEIEIGKVPFIIRYREGKDPHEFLRALYLQEGMRIEEIVALLNRGQEVKVSSMSVAKYIDYAGLSLGRGRPGDKR